MAFPLRFSLNQTLNSRTLALKPVPASSFVASHISSLSSFPSSSIAHHRHLKLKKFQRKSAEEVPVELDEESKFVPLNPEETQYGPPALLVLGFELEEHVKLQQFLKELDGEFIQVVYCTEDMLTRSLWDAVSTKQPNLQEVKIARSVPRICFLSGLTGEEMMMFIDAFPETGLEPAVFAALVPNSADKPVEELMEEIMGDHEMITAREVNK